MNKLTKPLIIIGSGRSGTTIISEIVFRHESLAWPSNYQERFPAIPQINLFRILFENKLWRLYGQKRQLNKVSALNKILFKPGEAYNFWEYITGSEIDFSRGFLLHKKANEIDRKRIYKAFSKMLTYQKKNRLAFKITGPARIGYLKSIFPDAIFINIIREPIATIHSWLHVDFWQNKGKTQLWWTGAYTADEEQWAKENASNAEALAALQYHKLMETTAIEIKESGANCLNIHYEDFVKNPREIIQQILTFADLPPSTSVSEYLENIKIYNQNSEKSPSSVKNYKNETLIQILEGKYEFSKKADQKS